MLLKARSSPGRGQLKLCFQRTDVLESPEPLNRHRRREPERASDFRRKRQMPDEPTLRDSDIRQTNVYLIRDDDALIRGAFRVNYVVGEKRVFG